MTPVISPAEELFGVGDLASPSAGTTTVAMPVGPWLRDPTGVISLGALGVLADDALGYAINEGAGPDGWSVTTEIALELVAPLPVGGRLVGEGRLDHADGRGALARGEIRDESGALLAYGHERGRFIDDRPDAAAVARGRVEHGLDLSWPPRADGLVELLSDVEVDEAGLRVRVGERFGNPRGLLHGGVSLCLAELAAAIAVPEQPTSTGIRIHYLRPAAIGATMLVEPTVVHRGRSLALVDVTAVGQHGRAIFRASVTRQ